MKSKEVYKEIDQIITPVLKEKGFKKAKTGMLGFYKLLKKNYLIIWFQCSQDGFDVHTGSKFVVELQISEQNFLGGLAIVRNRIPWYLLKDELSKIVELENEIRSKFFRPQSNHYIFTTSKADQDWYFKKFEPLTEEYINSSDIWFKFYDNKDIRKWLYIIEPAISRIIADYESSDY